MTQLAITTGTTYNNMSLSPGKTYYYAVQSVDTANDDSPLSPTVSATTLLLPTIPSNVAAQGTSSSQISVNWLPSSGSLPIAHYNVLRGTSPNSLSQVATTINPTYTDRSLPAGTTYYYGIQAADTGQDLSPMSPAVAGATQQ
jgi:fibronectin type 3 domain-containing protein